MLFQMSVTDDLPEMDGADLLGLLLHDGQDGFTEPFFPDDSELIESWLSEQDVSSEWIHSHLCNNNSMKMSTWRSTYFSIQFLSLS